MINKYIRGSEWRKWDLHLHTPDTKLNDQFNNDWSSFLEKIANSDIDVFGITDYFSFDSFLTLHSKIEEIKNNNEDLFNKLRNKKFFPNLELRLDLVDKNNNNVNIHILFNNQIPNRNEVLKILLTKLKLNKEDGKFSDKNVNYKKDYTTIDHIKNALQDSNIEEKDYLIITPMNGYGNSRNFNDSKDRTNETLEPVRNFSDLFFGKKDNNDYTNQDYKKPTLFCSDAHCLGDLCIYNEDRSKGYTWIKADPTFNGLKQFCMSQLIE